MQEQARGVSTYNSERNRHTFGWCSEGPTAACRATIHCERTAVGMQVWWVIGTKHYSTSMLWMVVHACNSVCHAADGPAAQCMKPTGSKQMSKLSVLQTLTEEAIAPHAG